jgi:hypothetical protein
MNFNRVQRAEHFSNGPLLLVANRGTVGNHCRVWRHTREQTEWTRMDHGDEAMPWSLQTSVGEKGSR